MRTRAAELLGRVSVAAILAGLLTLAAVVLGLTAALGHNWWQMALAGVLGIAAMSVALLSLRE